MHVHNRQVRKSTISSPTVPIYMLATYKAMSYSETIVIPESPPATIGISASDTYQTLNLGTGLISVRSIMYRKIKSVVFHIVRHSASRVVRVSKRVCRTSLFRMTSRASRAYKPLARAGSRPRIRLVVVNTVCGIVMTKCILAATLECS